MFDEHKKLPTESYVCGWYVYWDCPCVCYGPYPTPTAQSEEDVNTTNPPTVAVDSPDILSDDQGDNSDIRRPTRDAGRDKRQDRIIPDVIVDPFPPWRNTTEKCCPRNCTEVRYSMQLCSYYKASSYFTVLNHFALVFKFLCLFFTNSHLEFNCLTVKRNLQWLVRNQILHLSLTSPTTVASDG